LRQRGIEFNMRIGLNTGLVVVGRIGDDLTMEYTAMGDTVNLASRMQRSAQPGTIRVSENTYRLTEGYFEFKPLGPVRLKGRAGPVKAYQLGGFGRAKTRFGVSVVRGLTPFVGRKKELDHLLDCFELAVELRALDMRASPYDLSDWGHGPVCIETSDGRRIYEIEQKRLSALAHPLRSRLIDALHLTLEAAK
jgi:hypothetical protein